MKELLAKYFGRILAILGCTTLVTACYGVPYDEYDPGFRIDGRVLDSETDQPIEDIKVRVTPSDEGYEGYPFVSTTSTSSDGSFDMMGLIETKPSSYIVECTDVDGELNGSYESVIEEIPYNESHDLIIKMAPKRK